MSLHCSLHSESWAPNHLAKQRNRSSCPKWEEHKARRSRPTQKGAVGGWSSSVRNMACERCGSSSQDDAQRNAAMQNSGVFTETHGKNFSRKQSECNVYMNCAYVNREDFLHRIAHLQHWHLMLPLLPPVWMYLHPVHRPHTPPFPERAIHGL